MKVRCVKCSIRFKVHYAELDSFFFCPNLECGTCLQKTENLLSSLFFITPIGSITVSLISLIIGEWAIILAIVLITLFFIMPQKTIEVPDKFCRNKS